MQNVAQYIRQARNHTRKVWFTGSTALYKGQGVCYVQATGTAADADERRNTYVALPTATDQNSFAGVACRYYPARTGGQVVEIFEPGSVCPVLVGVPTTVNSTVLTCSKTSGEAGIFSRTGYVGRGTAIALQTTTGIASAASFDGSATISSATITKTGAGANVTANMLCYVIGGGGNTTGVYTVSSRTSNTIVLSSAPGGSASVAFYVIDSTRPTALCYLFDGEESGLQETVTAVDNAETSPACSTSGMTFVVGGITLGTGTTKCTIADGTIPGQRKGFQLNGTLTTNGLAVTATSSNILKPTFATTASITGTASGTCADLVWNGAGSKWLAIGGLGTLA